MTAAAKIEITPNIVADMLDAAWLPYDPEENLSNFRFYPAAGKLPF